ncbi:hypothetical protein HKK80_13270 [Halonotius sp. F2-221B]|uniref:hypothetical protein n=1 Tax=Halonotius sp. F2-221B TaxID=2731620 RepID=UPI00398A937E
MERRQYLAAAAAGGAIGVGGVGGYVLLSDDVGFGPPGVPTAPYPPYPTADGEGEIEPISLSGSGQATTDAFELVRGGPTIIDTDAGDAADDERFRVVLVSTADDEEEYRVIEVLGPFTGRNLLNPPPGEYELAVQEASADWTATVYDVPAYDTDEIDLELEPPIVFSDGLDAVIGPIDFGSQQAIEFSLSVGDEDIDYSLSLVDSNGEVVEPVIQSLVGRTDPQQREVGGIGYLAVDGNTTWTLRAEPVDDGDT